MARWQRPTTVAAAVLLSVFLSNSVRGQHAYTKQTDVVYVERDDQKLKADLYLPAGEGPFPGVLLVHGGAWFMGSKSHMVFHAGRLAKAGYAVVAISYRFAPQHKFPAQIEDCKEAVRWMRRNSAKYKIDPERIAGFGYSAGAHLVALLGTTDADDGLEGANVKGDSTSTRLQAVVAGGAPCDFQWLPENNRILAYWLGGSRGEKPDLYRQASPIAFVTKDDPPVFFYHGEADFIVPRKYAEQMAEKLQEVGVETRFHLMSGKGHIAVFLDMSATEKAIEFLDEMLKQPEQ